MNQHRRRPRMAYDRTDRINRLWQEFVRLSIQAGRPEPADPGNADGRQGRLVVAARRGHLPAHLFGNVIDAAEVGLEDQFSLRTPEAATSAQPGSQDKFRVLCDRIARGEELWHAADRHCL